MWSKNWLIGSVRAPSQTIPSTVWFSQQWQCFPRSTRPASEKCRRNHWNLKQWWLRFEENWIHILPGRRSSMPQKKMDWQESNTSMTPQFCFPSSCTNLPCLLHILLPLGTIYWGFGPEVCTERCWRSFLLFEKAFGSHWRSLHWWRSDDYEDPISSQVPWAL